jgi:radical SAM-linked protein
VTHPSDASAAPAPPPAFEPRQRWRVAFARDAPPTDLVPTGRDYIAQWEETVLASGLPALVLATGRPRIALGAPLPVGCSADRELLEFWLVDVDPAWAVREGIESNLPAGHRLVGLENIWTGAPALSGQVAAADYDVELEGSAAGPDLAAGLARLVAARTLPRERLKGGVAKTYDLRPLIVSLEARGITLRMRTRIHPELGTGRPDEIVAALADELGVELAIERIRRRRLLLVDDLES